MVLKRVGPVSCAKIVGTLYAFLGLLIGAIFSLVSMIGLAAELTEGPAILALFFGVGAVLWLPLFYGALGFVMALIGAGLYNVLAGLVGGIEVQLE